MIKTKKLIFFQFILFFVFLNYPSMVNAFVMQKNIFLETNNKQKISIPDQEFSKWITDKYSLIYSPKYKSQIENITYCPTDKIFCSLTMPIRHTYSMQKKDFLIINKKTIEKYLKKLGNKLNKNPINPTFKIDDRKVIAFSLGQPGLKINTEKTTRTIIKFLSNKNNFNNNTIPITFDTVPPEVSADNTNNLGIKTLIGEGKSNFSGSTKSRIHNIKVASSRFNGLLIKPGEEFSFVKNLGPVDGEHGYKPELVIKNNVTTPEFGGGICQVSTTVFRAAIYSGLKITARKNHAYPVHYYNPQGFDATVYIPKPDLRFINNTPGYILIQTNINLDKKELVFKFYGTDDGRKVKVDGPHIVSRGAGGAMKTVFTQKVFDAKGNMFINDTFKSNYASPSKYPHPGQTTIFTKKPKNWSKSQWKKYKKEHHL